MSPRRRKLPVRPRRAPVGPWGNYVNDLRVSRGMSYFQMYEPVNQAAKAEGETNTHYGRHTIRNWIGGVVPTSADTLRWIGMERTPQEGLGAGRRPPHVAIPAAHQGRSRDAPQPPDAPVIIAPVEPLRSAQHQLLPSTTLGLSHDGSSSETTQEPPDTERRPLLTLLGAIIAGTMSRPLNPGSWEALATAAAVEPVMQVIPQYRRLDGQIPSGQLLDPVRAHLNLAAHLTAHAQTPWAKGQLAGAASEAASFTAWLLLDMNDPSKARDYYKIAVQLATAAGNPLLHIYQLGSLAALAAELGDAGQAVALCRHLTQLLPNSAPSTAVAWLASLQAVAHAAAGHEVPSMSALERAESLVSQRSSDLAWPWLSPFDTGKLLATSARCHLMLNKLPTALPFFERALSLDAVSTRRRGELLIGLATTYARLRQPEPACLILVQALGLAGTTRSHQLLTRIHAVRDELDPLADTPDVARLSR